MTRKEAEASLGRCCRQDGHLQPLHAAACSSEQPCMRAIPYPGCVTTCLQKRLLENERQSRGGDRKQSPMEFPLPQTVHGDQCPKVHRWDSPYCTGTSTLMHSGQKHVFIPQLHEPMHTFKEHISMCREKRYHALNTYLICTHLFVHETSVCTYPWCIPVLSIPTRPALPTGLTQSIPDQVALSNCETLT